MDKIRGKTYNFLRWSEKYTGTDMVYLTKGISWLTFGQIAGSISSLLLAYAFANLISPTIYGNYKFILSIAGILSITTLKGTSTALTRSIANNFDGTFKEILKTKLRWSILGVIGGLGISVWYFINENTTLGYSFLIVSVLSPLVDVFTVNTSFLQGKKFFSLSTKYFIYSQLISVGSLILTIYLTDNIFIMLFSYFVPILLTKLFVYRIVVNKKIKNDLIDPIGVSFGKKLSLINVIPVIANHIDKVLLFHYLGAVQVAVYSFAIAIPDQIFSFFNSINVLALPKFASKEIKDIRKSILKRALMIMPILAIIIVIYYYLAPYIYNIIFPQYIESIKISQIYILAIVGVMSFLPDTALGSQGKARPIAQLLVLNSIAKIAIIFVLIFYYGLIGAVIARVITKSFKVFSSFLILFKSKYLN